MTDTYVSIEDMLYKVPSVLYGVDVCFKSYFVLNCKYPPESEHIWLIIQKAVFEINTSLDKRIPIVHQVLNDLEKICYNLIN